MTRRYLGILVFALGAGAGASAAPRADQRSVSAKAYDQAGALAFVREHCVDCHNARKAKGKLRLDDLTGQVREEGSRWRMALDQLRAGQMPPEDRPQPADAERRAMVAWIEQSLARHAPRRPNEGNLVPHAWLFDASPGKGQERGKPGEEAPTPPRLWRLGAAGYMGWVEDVAKGGPKGVVQPFSSGEERGIRDFAELARVDLPSTEILLRNAVQIVEHQTRHALEDGKFQAKNDTVRELVDLMDASRPPTRAQLEKAIQKQFSLAIARQARPAEVDDLLEFYQQGAKGGDQVGAARAMLAAVLLRSEAVFRGELGGSEGRLTPFEAALAVGAALAHRREPAILEAAQRGQLATRAQVAQHVRRILDDPKFPKPRLLGFFREYFEYGQATEVFKDEPKDLWHRPDQAVQDTDRLVLHILEQDKDVFRQLLSTPLAFANVRMSTNKQTRQQELVRALVPNAHNQRGKATPEALYGLNEWTAAQPFEQKPGTRLGILMQPSWLIAWSENFNNDIVRRGRFIRERLLGGVVPDLPIGVAAMIPDERTHTLRQRVGSATRAEACWRCHRHMDDLGLPFENFDHYGRLLDSDLVLDPEATKKNVDSKGKPLGDVHRAAPLDTSGLVAGTGVPGLDGPVKDPRELVLRIANSEHCRQVWIRHVFRYYLGRNECLADAPSLREADRAYVQSGGSFKALLESLLSSDAFLRRAAPAQASTPSQATPPSPSNSNPARSSP